MLKLEKEIILDMIQYKIKLKEDEDWKLIGTTIIWDRKMLAILAGLKMLPPEIREKIVFHLVIDSFQEFYFLQQITDQIHFEYDCEEARLQQEEAELQAEIVELFLNFNGVHLIFDNFFGEAWN